VSVAKRAPRAARGQHFLRSSRLAAELVARAGIEPGSLALDVGAGTGVVTRALRAAGAQVVAVELDPALASALRRALPDVRVVCGDAAALAWPREPFAVVANLPFARSGEILRTLLGGVDVPLARAELILQWEAAVKRAAPWPTTLRGALWSARYDLRVERHVAPEAFAPPPAVECAVLSVRRRAQPLVAATEQRAYEQLLRAAFATRAPLRRGLAGVVSARELKRLAVELGFSRDAAARDLDAHQWAALYAATRHERRA
jgi:23S rRNA (adenine-N6)-dimethyltransferase